MLMMSFVTIGIVSVLWTLYGFSVAFGPTGNGFWGGLRLARDGRGLKTLAANGAQLTIPNAAFSMFQLMFAIITPALISGAIADRAKFLGWAVFVDALGDAGLLPGRALGLRLRRRERQRRGLARAAGRRSTSPAVRRSTSTPVPRASPWRSSSASATAGRKDPMQPHNLPLVMLGAGLLWFGWFGFNAGSALGGQRPRRRWRSSTRRSRPPPPCSAGSSSSGSATGTPPRSASPPARSPAWSPSPRRARSSCRRSAILLGLVAGVDLRLRRRPEVPARLRRLARRRRRPPGRRHRRLPASSASSAPRRPTSTAPAARRRRAVLRRRLRPAGQAGAGGRLGARSTRSSSRSSSASSSTRRSASGSTPRTRRRGIDLDQHAETGVRDQRRGGGFRPTGTLVGAAEDRGGARHEAHHRGRSSRTSSTRSRRRWSPSASRA